MNGLSLGVVRGFPRARFALRLGADGSDVTLLSASEGGSVYADVVSVSEAALPFAKKHLGPPEYEAFTIQIGLAVSKRAFDWVAGSWESSPGRMDGAVITHDADFNIRSEARFSGALVVETDIPALDAASKDAGLLTVRFQPEFIQVAPGAGKLSLVYAKQKLWRTANFRLDIDGLDCTKVRRIEPFTVTRQVTVVSSGRGGAKLVPDKVLFPNLRITLAEISAKTWRDWHKSFVVDGNNGDAFERNGTITLLSNDLQTALSRIELHHLGIIRVASVPSDAASQIGLVTADLYCEQMVLSPGANP